MKIVRAISNWVSRVIRDCIGFALLRSVIYLENLRHPLNQSDAKVKPIATWSLAFSRAWGRLHVFTLSSHWLPLKFSFVLIGRYDYFGFGFTTLNRKALYLPNYKYVLLSVRSHLQNNEMQLILKSNLISKLQNVFISKGEWPVIFFSIWSQSYRMYRTNHWVFF